MDDTKEILECTIIFASDCKRSFLIRPKITVWKCFSNTRSRVHKTKATTNLRMPLWEETVRVEYPMPDATLVFQLTDMFSNNLVEATLSLTDITQRKNSVFPLVSKKGETLGTLLLTLSIIDHVNKQPTTTNNQATDRLEKEEQISSILNAIIEVASGCASFNDDNVLD